MSKTISHLYNDYPSARAAASELEAAGIKGGDISIVASNADGWYKNENDDVKHVDIAHDKDRDGVDDRTEGARTGAGIGGVAAGAAGLAAGLGLLAIDRLKAGRELDGQEIEIADENGAVVQTMKVRDVISRS